MTCIARPGFVGIRIDVDLAGARYQCFLVSSSERGDASEPIDHYIVAGLGWVKLGRTTGALVEVAPLSKDGALLLEKVAPLIATAAQSFGRNGPA